MKILGCGALVLILGCCWIAIPSSAQNHSPVRSTDAVDRMSVPWWANRHRQVLEEVKQHPDTPLLLIGDSITNNYDKRQLPDQDFAPTWRAFYGSRRALNLGFSGDTTSNVLWRLRNGEVDSLHPRAVVLLIGTNNTGVACQDAQETERGIDAVIAELERRLPQTQILLLGILPSAVSEEKSIQDRAVNQYLATSYGETHRVTYIDITSVFVRGHRLLVDRFYDPRLPQHRGALHPDTIGQRWMAEAIEPTLARFLDEPPAFPLSELVQVNTATIPVPWLEQDSYDWYGRHHQALAAGQLLQPCMVFLGDSITHFWGGEPLATRASGEDVWKEQFGETSVLNLGFGWDRTQNVLWRLQQRELGGLRPEWVVLNIGTNNLVGTSHARANTPVETASGIAAIIEQIHSESPTTRVALMGIFPRGFEPNTDIRSRITATNQLLASFAQTDPKVTWIDIGGLFLSKSGSLPRDLMPDGTHPNEAGYRLWAESLTKNDIRCTPQRP